MHIKRVWDAAEYWEIHQHKFPFQTKRRIGNPGPLQFEREVFIPDNFICCPIQGIAYWGFVKQEHLDLFNRLYPEPSNAE